MKKLNYIFALAVLILPISQFIMCKERKVLTIDELNSLIDKKPGFLANGFSYPLGGPNHRGYYNAQKFGEVNRDFGGNKHLGEDWNGVKGGNSDLGDPVQAIANGYVVYADEGGPGWGKVIRIIHRLPKGKKYTHLESLYGHIINIKVSKGDFVKKGQLLGGIGNVNGLYYAHLHIELRYMIDMPIGGGYGQDLEGFLSLSRFMQDYK